MGAAPDGNACKKANVLYSAIVYCYQSESLKSFSKQFCFTPRFDKFNIASVIYLFLLLESFRVQLLLFKNFSEETLLLLLCNCYVFQLEISEINKQIKLRKLCFAGIELKTLV